MPRLLPFRASLALLALSPTPLLAQRSVALLVVTGNATGHARAEADPDHPTITPDHPAGLELAAAQEHRGWRVAIRLRYTQADLAIRGATSAILTRGAIRTSSLGLEGGHRLAGRSGASTLHALLGASVEQSRFPVTGGDPRTGLGLHAALDGSVPLATHWVAVIRGEASRTTGIFAANELPPGYAVRAGRRWHLGVGVGWRP